MRDLYAILGVSKNADAEEIKKSYRKLAKKLHPDVNPGNKDIEKKFKELSLAYDILGDAAKRKKYDRGLIDAEGNEKTMGNYGFRQQRGGGSDPFANFDAQDIFADLFQSARRKANIFGEDDAPATAKKGADIAYTLQLAFLDAAKGCKRKITAGADGKTVEVTIPPGSTDGQVLRLKGLGQSGGRGGAAGDLLLTLQVEADAQFIAKGQNIYTDLPITIAEAVLGASVTATTIDGKVNVAVPKNSNSGTMLRLKARGLLDTKTKIRGDQFLRLVVHLPDKPDKKFTDFIQNWAEKNPYSVREE